MKQKIKGLISVALCFMLMFQSVNINAATKVKINKTKASIYVGKTVQLKIKGTKKKVKWKSSNKKVATVTSNGKVKGIKKGTAKITATVSKKKYICKVTVKKKVNNNTRTTSKPTTSTKPSTTNKPAISDTIISNFSSLKAYIAKYGQTNSSGNKFIKTSLTNNSFGIVYDATNSKYTFVVSGTTSNGKTDYALSMDVKETYLGDGEIGCAIIITNGFCAELDTTSSLQDINGKSELNWTVTSSTGGDNASWISMANTVLNIGYIGWDLLVYETLNLKIKDFGFGGDIQTSVDTPTNTPIVTATPTITPSSIVATTPIPTSAPIVTLGAIEACNIGESYTSKNGLNVCVNYVANELFAGVSYICKINYAIKNNTSQTIKRPIFRVFSENGNVYYQNGTFNDLKPGKNLQNQYHVISMVMPSNPTLLEKPIILELVTDKDDTEANYKDTLNPNELHWIVP